jgi:hypothetical protein
MSAAAHPPPAQGRSDHEGGADYQGDPQGNVGESAAGTWPASGGRISPAADANSARS